jgi:hypothetical protein
MSEANKMIFRMDREERFETVRRYLRHNVIVTARPDRRAPTADAKAYPGWVEAVAWGLFEDNSRDVIVLVLTGPPGEGMPMVAIELSKIVSIKEIPNGG